MSGEYIYVVIGHIPIPYGTFSDYMLARQMVITLTHRGRPANIYAYKRDVFYWEPKDTFPEKIYENTHTTLP